MGGTSVGRPALAFAFAFAFAALGGVARAAAPLQGAGGPGVIPGQYIVVMKSDASAAAKQRTKDKARSRGARIARGYRSALDGYAASLPMSALAAVRADPAVAYVEADAVVSAMTPQSDAPWGLDRIDQRSLPPDGNYSYDASGVDVKAYIIDSGVRVTHDEFGGRAITGSDHVGDERDSRCYGHGTHVAGTVGGSTYGVAKEVSLVAVRVLSCSGTGKISGVLAGIDWVTADHGPGEPAVATMSLGGGPSAALDQAVQNSIADGVSYAVAAGNGDRYGNPLAACSVSPARAPHALTVAATASTDARARFSNLGGCVDVFAPGVGIASAWSESDSATRTLDGTSMATPHVAGVVALYLQIYPSASPARVARALKHKASAGAVKNAGIGSPNRLLYSLVGPPRPPTLSGTAPASPASDNHPKVMGRAAAGSTIKVYKTADCSGAAAVSGTAAAFGSRGLTVAVDEATTTLRATATDAVGDASACSASSVDYVSTAPSARLVKDVNGVARAGSSPANLTMVGSTLYFTANDASHGVELFKSDGTAAGTTLVKDLNPKARAGSSPANLTPVGDSLYFSANDGRHGVELFKSDGSAAGTTLVKDLDPKAKAGSDPALLTAAGSSLFFRASDGRHGVELFKSDGTAAGTTMVKDLNPKAGASSTPALLTPVTDPGDALYRPFRRQLFFRATDGRHGVELFVSDGSAAGTTLVKDLNPGRGAGSTPKVLTAVGSRLYFSANDARHGRELFASDGTAAGTTLVKDLNPRRAAGSTPTLLTAAGSRLYFAANNASQGTELFVSDGTAAGTTLVKDVNPKPRAGSSPASLTVADAGLYFRATDGSHGAELFKSDGTAAGTTLVKDVNPAAGASSSPALLTVAGASLYFRATDGTRGVELFKSDGTAAGTTLLSDVNPIGRAGSSTANLIAVGDRLYFTANDASHGLEPFSSDATPSGTTLVKDVNPTSKAGSGPARLTAAGASLYFTASDGKHGRELWTAAPRLP